MRIEKFCSVTFLLWLTCTNLYAQSNDGMSKNEYAPASPNASSFGKYDDVPIDFSTGVPNISVPIYELKEGKIILPISINYHAGGIKVQEEASSVGLGWTLNAGGVINRIVRGLPDENFNGYFSTRTTIKNMLNGIITGQAYLDNEIKLVQGQMDGEPDLFICSIAGLHFKFSMDIDGDFVTFPNSNYKISYVKSTDDIQDWVVTDDNGNKYEFGGTADGVQLTEIVVKSTEPQSASAWFIRRILPVSYSYSASAQKKILFHYINNLESTPLTVVQTDYRGIGSGTSQFPVPGFSSQTVSNLHRTAYLSSIDWAEGRIVFNQTKNRDDNPDLYKMNDIEVRNVNGVVIKKCRFIYDYFTAPHGRMKLVKLVAGIENSINPITNEFYQPPVYEFEYIDGVTDINSRAQDHWGFYNGASPTQNLFPSFRIFIPSLFQYMPYSYSNDRSVKPDFANMGMIKKIKYPTGGWSEFEFESNTESNINLERTLVDQTRDINGNFYCGGMRIKKLRTVDPFHPGKDIIKLFDYTADNGKSSGKITELPVYAFVQDKLAINCSNAGGGSACTNYEDVDYVVIKETSQFPLVNKNNTVYYSKVTVYNGENGENGKDEYYYNFAAPAVSDDQLSLPFVPIWQQDWKNGIAKEIHYKKANSQFKKILEKTFEYSSARPVYKVKGLKSSITKLVHNYFDFVFSAQVPQSQLTTTSEVVFYSDFNYLSLETSKTYSSDDESTFLQSKVSYEADPVSLQVNKIVSTHSDGKIEEIRRRFSGNYEINGQPRPNQPYLSGIYNLQQHNISGALVEETKAVNNEVVQCNVTTYSPYAPSILSSFSRRFLPGISLNNLDPITYSEYTGDWDFPEKSFYKLIDYTEYDEYGNVILQRIKDGHAVVVLWDHTANLPIAEIKLGNADHDIALVATPKGIQTVPNLAFTSFEGSNYGFWTGVQSEGIQNNISAPTGSRVYELAAGSISHNFNNAADYYLYLWKKTNASVTVVSDRPASNSQEVAFTVGDWQLMKYSLINTRSVFISGHGLIDELRLFPKDARMTTLTYFPALGIQSQADANGRVTSYVYDPLGRLWYVKDMKGNILKSFDYTFQQ